MVIRTPLGPPSDPPSDGCHSQPAPTMTGRALRPASADATTPQRADLQSPPAAAPTRGPARAPAAAGRPDPVGTPRVRPVPYAAPTGVAPDATARARNRAGDADLVVPPTVHLHGGPEGEVSAELSAGRIQWVDGLNACTVRNLSARLFSAKPEVGGRLIRLGCLFSPAARAGFLGDTFDGVGLPSGDGRSPAQAKADRGSFEAIVHLANYCAAFRLDVECTRAVVEQALHVAEKGNHHLVKSVLSGVRNDYQKHSVSATHGGKKTTMATYAGYIKRFCAWGVAGERVGTRLVPLSRHTVVLFLEAEAKRRLVRRAAPRRGAGMADEADSDDGDEDAEDEGDGAGVGPSNDAAAVGDGGADDGPPPKRLQRGFGAPASTTPNARTEANRRAAAASLVGRGVTGGTGGGGNLGTYRRRNMAATPARVARGRAGRIDGGPARQGVNIGCGHNRATRASTPRRGQFCSGWSWDRSPSTIGPTPSAGWVRSTRSRRGGCACDRRISSCQRRVHPCERDGRPHAGASPSIFSAAAIKREAYSDCRGGVIAPTRTTLHATARGAASSGRGGGPGGARPGGCSGDERGRAGRFWCRGQRGERAGEACEPPLPAGLPECACEGLPPVEPTVAHGDVRVLSPMGSGRVPVWGLVLRGHSSRRSPQAGPHAPGDLGGDGQS